jgi:hypothetical protein
LGGIEMKNGLLVYYGNPAGYLRENKATVDTMFQSKEFEEWLSEKKLIPNWTDGVFERLSKGGKLGDPLEASNPLKNIRIWQLKPDSDFELRFRAYDDVVTASGEPSKDNYGVVFDGELDTNNLESIYTKFNMDHPSEFKGHSLSISDVVELYDENSSEFHYVDQFGFKAIEFADQSQEQEHSMTLGM